MLGSGIRNEQLKQQVELFILVPSSTNIRLAEKSQQIYNQSPTHNIEGSQGFKQLPKTLRLKFNLEEKQYMTITVLNRSNNTLFGRSFPISLNKICSLRKELNTVPLFNGDKESSQLAIHCAITSSKSYQTTVAISTKNICKKVTSFWCCSSHQSIKYYFIIHQAINQGNIILQRSHQISERSYTCEPMRLIASNDQPLTQIVVNFYQCNTNNPIGHARVDLAQARKETTYYLNGKDKTQGFFQLQIISNEKRHHFLQFYNAGMELALTVAIDFTLSNLPYKQKRSLHYHTDTQASTYQKVLSAVCPVLLDFDTDKKVPVYGFGAIEAGNEITSHYFPLAKHRQNYEVHQTQGIINIYKQVMPSLTFKGPSYFAPMLQENIIQCRKIKDKPQVYKILLILTDGDILDYQQTKDLIIECSQLPISIIIVGISRDENERWQLMNRLNNDRLQLKDRRGRCATRDMVTFVPYFQTIRIPGLFQKQLLKQIPMQISQYHRLARIKPSDYTVKRVGLDAFEASHSDMIRMKNRFGLQKDINPEQIKPSYHENQEQMMKLPEVSNLKSKQRVKNFYQDKQ